MAAGRTEAGGGMGPNVGNNTGNPPVNYAARWSYDSVGNQESISTYADNYTLATYPTLYIYEYGSQYSNGGEVWQVDGTAGSYSCVDATLSDSVENPLESERGGVISFTQLFTNSAYDLSTFKYVGRSLQRGVTADWYRASFTNVATTDTAYYGNLAVHLHRQHLHVPPLGGCSPAVPPPATCSCPCASPSRECSGNLTSGVNSTFLDAYSIFELFPASDIMTAASTGLVSSSWFTDTPSAYSCPAYVASSTSSSGSSSGLSGGAIAGIVIAVLVVAAVLLVVVVVCRRLGGGKLMGKTSYGGSETVTVAGTRSGWKSQKDEGDEPSVSHTSEQEMV